MTFNLRATINQVIDTTDLAGPGAVANQVDKLTSDEDLRTAYQQALRKMVVQVFSERRMSTAFVTDHPQSPAAEDGVEVPRKKQKYIPSRKGQLIREWWQQVLRDRVHCGPSAADWKLLGDCTFDDLMFAAGERRTQAERQLAKADQYSQLAQLVRDHRVKTVGALPDKLLSETLVRAA